MAEKKTETNQTKKGMDPKVAGLLAWLFCPISSLIFMLIEDMKQDKTIQHHAKQSLWYGIINIAAMAIIWVPCIGWLIGVAFLVGRLIFAFQAYSGKEVKVPVIGDMIK
ncbi:hypothetical protein JW887_04680 [Candidatus Dojkabacteria bacterium]|nr:hypothetical protein [Candidatus Dojkabacteria bacterium]